METDGQKLAQWITSPLGGFAIAALLKPVGCAESVGLLERCPIGQATNFLGMTAFGNVGRFGDAELVVIGFLVAIVLYLGVGSLPRPKGSGPPRIPR